jgi:NADH:ubiquinone oxidoreductase subunit 2 (subunit N)
MQFFSYSNLITFELYDNFININYIDKSWFFFSNIISILLISFYIILLGIVFPNKAKIVKFLNLISAFYLLIFFYLATGEYICSIENINVIFQQNYSLYVNLFFVIATITVFLFFLSISDVFYLEENMKIEYTLLVFYIYIGALLLISSLDFISIIILLECIAFSSYVLVGFERKNKFSTSAALKYLILAAIPSGLFILGISLLYNNYGTFYQDYLDLLLVSFNAFDLTSIDWLYSTKYYADTFGEITSYLPKYIKYVTSLNKFCQIYNPLIVLYILDLERVLQHFPENYLDHLITVEKQQGLFTIDNVTQLKNSFAEAYVEYYASYLFILKTLTEFYSIWEIMYFMSTGSYIIHDRDIVDLLYLFLKEMGDSASSILNWFSFFSTILYLDLLTKPGSSESLMLHFFCVPAVQEGNIRRLTAECFNTWFTMFDYANFWIFAGIVERTSARYAALYVDYSMLSISKTLLTGDALSFFNLILKDADERINTLADFSQIVFQYWYNIYTNFGINMSMFSFETTACLCLYNNIFLSTYLVIIFVLINLSFKITAAPFHLWAPSVYGGSPLPTITFLSVFSKLTIIFLFMNLFLTVFDNLKFIWQPILFFLGVFSIIISILGAFSEKLFKRFFVYSSIGHVGFMILGIAVLNYDGIQGTIDYLVLYIVSSFIIWFIVMHLTKKTTHLISFKGLSYNYEALSLILVISLFSISGLPPMGGFFVKFEIFYSLLNSSQYYIAYILFLLTVFSFFYYLRLIKIIYFEDNITIKKNKNLNDIKLRIISLLIFILPLYILLMQEPIFYILKNIIISSFI